MRNASIAAGFGAALGLLFWATFRFAAGIVSRLVSSICRWQDSRQERTSL
jgi:hypothetical protein